MQLIYDKIRRATAWLLVIMIAAIFTPQASGKDKKVFTVVIDAGHGGSDPGTSDNDAVEKDINLGVALRLGEKIRKLKDTKVILTRDDDTFVSLQDRADVANKAGAHLFISIHTNSAALENPNRASATGASTYVRSLDKDKDNLDVTKRENQVIELDEGDRKRFADFNPVDMLSPTIQMKNLQNSTRLAEYVQDEMIKIGRKVHGKGKGVHQAGFRVLWATAMPSILIELDFICNPKEAAYLTSEKGQEELAGAIFNAVKKYERYFRGER